MPDLPPTHCDDCGGRLNRPGLHGCTDALHPAPDLARRIVAAIERDLTDRRGFSWDGLDEDIQYDIRDTWTEAIRALLRTEATHA